MRSRTRQYQILSFLLARLKCQGLREAPPLQALVSLRKNVKSSTVREYSQRSPRKIVRPAAFAKECQEAQTIKAKSCAQTQGQSLRQSLPASDRAENYLFIGVQISS